MSTFAKQKFQSLAKVPPGPALTEANTFIEGICGAICAGHEQWRSMAAVSGVVINGPTAIGGRLEGPGIDAMMGAYAPQAGLQGWAPKYSRAITSVMTAVWKEFLQTFRVPGIAWYPTFAAFPGPSAPATPNIPSPLGACTGGASMFSAGTLKARMIGALGGPGPSSAEVFESVATGFQQSIQVWLSVQMLTNVLGMGPVPTFSPPTIPVGPVVGGNVIPMPGHLKA